MSYRQRVYDLFVDHPHVPFDGIGLSRVGGAYAWRSRVAEVRQILRAEGRGDIVNQLIRQMNGSMRSFYTFVPKAASKAA